MGLIDASKPRSYRPRGLLGPVGEEATSTATVYEGNIGGETPRDDIRGTAKDLRSFSGLSDYFNDPDVQKNGRALGAMAMAMSPTMVGAKMAAPGLFGGLPGSDGSYGGGGVSAADLGASLAEGNTTGMFAKGGKVGRKGLLDGDPPGPDNVIIGAKTGERILNEEQYAKLSPEAKKEVDALMKKAKR